MEDLMKTMGNGTNTLSINLKENIGKAQLTWDQLDMHQLMLDNSSDW